MFAGRAAGTGGGITRGKRPSVAPVRMAAPPTPRDAVRSSTEPSVFVPSELECTATRTGFNTNLDCDDPFPNNEPDIQVDPADPRHMVASSNDYGSCCDQFYTTFDRGRTWQTGNMSVEDPGRTGSDPVSTFDVRTGTVLHSSLNYTFNADGTQTCDGDLVVSRSKDGGLTWGEPWWWPAAWLRPGRAAAVQRQGVDGHRQQPPLAVLRPDLPHLDPVRVPQR
jgi:hypothetical protein